MPEHETFGSFVGRSFEPLPEELRERLPAWLEARAVPEGQILKQACVFGWGDWVFKFGSQHKRFRDRFRQSPAMRSARLYERLRPIRSPRPLLVLSDRRSLDRFDDLLVMEWVRGRFAHELWGKDPGAQRALAGFMSQMTRRGIFHGDFHVNNFLWNGNEWVLLDLTGIRHFFRTLRRRPLVVEQWAKLYLTLERVPSVQETFQLFAELTPGYQDADLWPAVLAHAAGIEHHWPKAYAKHPESS